MHSGQPRYSFRNLQPINYLNQFNHMVEYTKRHPVQSSARSDLNLVPLTKFPISRYYQDMEGIFQNLVRKKQDQGDPQRTRQSLQEQKFMERHNEFMRKVLTKFIIHNQERMQIFQREKRKARNTDKGQRHFRSLSQPKLVKKIEVKSQSLRKSQNKTLELPEIVTLKPETPAATKISMIKEFKTHPEIVNLQVKQARKQSVFAEKIQQQIAKFDKQMEGQVKAIKQMHFQRDTGSSKKEARRERRHEPTETMEMEVGIRNFAST